MPAVKHLMKRNLLRNRETQKRGRNEKDRSDTVHAGCDPDGIERGVISG